MICTIALTALMAAAAPHHARLDTALVELLTGAKGRLDRKENVFKVSVPRGDLNVTVDGVKLIPSEGLTSWAAFAPAGSGFMVMGDLVLTEDQVNPVLDAALANGLEVTALHNHFLGESPRVMFMHVGGMGTLTRLAQGVAKTLDRIKEPGVPRPSANIDPTQSRIDCQKIAATLGHSGDLTGGVYKVTLGRTARMHGQAIGAAMGVNTWAAFAGSDSLAMVDGDFAMREHELQPVLRALRRANIMIVAIHQHMIGEEPRIMFLHYWGIGPAQELARGLRAALDHAHAP
jgi:hypothetical protein